jgi:hypothetical protein
MLDVYPHLPNSSFHFQLHPDPTTTRGRPLSASPASSGRQRYGRELCAQHRAARERGPPGRDNIGWARRGDRERGAGLWFVEMRVRAARAANRVRRFLGRSASTGSSLIAHTLQRTPRLRGFFSSPGSTGGLGSSSSSPGTSRRSVHFSFRARADLHLTEECPIRSFVSQGPSTAADAQAFHSIPFCAPCLLLLLFLPAGWLPNSHRLELLRDEPLLPA